MRISEITFVRQDEKTQEMVLRPQEDVPGTGPFPGVQTSHFPAPETEQFKQLPVHAEMKRKHRNKRYNTKWNKL